MIFVIDDDIEMAKCVARMIKAFCKEKVLLFQNAISAIGALNNDVPKLIFLDVLLDGPDGFTFLNELSSYEDTKNIPVVIMSSLDFADKDLSNYGVVRVLSKEKMTPGDFKEIIETYAG